MAYKYYTSGSSVTFQTPTQSWANDFQELLSDQFLNAPNIYTIQEESSFASGSMVDIAVRIDHAIDGKTGEKLGDDFKLILFGDLNHATDLGAKYYFDNCYWLVFNTETIKNLAASCTVRRCNNALRWVDENGILYTEPCVIDYEISAPRDYGKGNFPTGEGQIHVYAQANASVKKLRENKRFLFGNSDNWSAFKIFGGGVRNFLNNSTLDNNSATLMQFAMGVNFVNADTDDMVNGVADYYDRTYVLNLSPASVVGNIGSSLRLMPSLTLANNPVTRNISYSSSASTVANVDSNGVIAFVASGSALITASMTDNPAVYDTCVVSVSGVPVVENEVRLTPFIDYIIEGNYWQVVSKLYVNGVEQADAFDVVSNASSTVPDNHYNLVRINDNTFRIVNIEKYLDAPLILDFVTRDRLYSKTVSINLRGAW